MKICVILHEIQKFVMHPQGFYGLRRHGLDGAVACRVTGRLSEHTHLPWDLRLFAGDFQPAQTLRFAEGSFTLDARVGLAHRDRLALRLGASEAALHIQDNRLSLESALSEDIQDVEGFFFEEVIGHSPWRERLRESLRIIWTVFFLLALVTFLIRGRLSAQNRDIFKAGIIVIFTLSALVLPRVGYYALVAANFGWSGDRYYKVASGVAYLAALLLALALGGSLARKPKKSVIP